MLTSQNTMRVGAIHVTRGKRTHSNLDYSILLDVIPRKGRPEIAASVREIIATSNMKVTKKSREALSVIVANLFAAWSTTGNPFLVVPMRPSEYSPGTRLRTLWLTFKPTTKVVHALHVAGFVEYHRGIYFEAKKRVTRIRAKTSLVALFIKHRFRLKSIETGPIEPVQLRKQKKNGAKGDSINISRGKHAAAARPFKIGLERINTALRATSIDLHIDEQMFIDHYFAHPNRKRVINPPHPFRNQLYRVFNVNFDQGGRFYGHWVQGLPRDLRHHIQINGESVVELDYKAIHPTLLYTERRLKFSGEVYLPISYHQMYRPVFKLLMLAAINARDLKGAVMGARHCIHSRKDLLYKYIDCLTDEWLHSAFRALEVLHQPIRSDFFTGAGLRLQRKDSQIAERVMLTLLDSGVVALPIHDSFLVSHRHEGALREAMLTASREVSGSAISVDKKPAYDDEELTELVNDPYKLVPVMDGAHFSSCSLPHSALAAFLHMDGPGDLPANRHRRAAA